MNIPGRGRAGLFGSLRRIFSGHGRELGLSLLAGVCATMALSKETARIQFTVSVPKPGPKVFEVECRLTRHPSKKTELDWAAWTPGYATIWNYGQFVEGLTAQDGKLHRLAVTKVSVNRWVIESENAGVVILKYRVRAIDPAANLGFAQAYLDSVCGWFNGAALFPQVRGMRNVEQSVRFNFPADWAVATPMKPGPEGNGYTVPDFDVLVDSPVQLGHFLRKDFQVDATRVGVVLAGSDSVDMDKLAGMLQTIVGAEFKLMGGSPIDRYLIIYHAAVRGAGGLEHLNATTISAPVAEFFKNDSWLKVATSHEFFHVWNAKRIHPKVFDVYDYSKPVHTRTVWFSEGITAYYADVVLTRSGLITKEDFYKDLAQIIDLYENNPAHRWLSWEDISWNVWNPKVQQGLSVWLLPGWMIDLKIRDVTDNRRSLDDVMRFMNVWFGEGESGMGEKQIGMICSAVAQKDIRPFFTEYIEKAKSFPYDSLLSAAGLKWRVDSVSTTDLGCKLWWTTATKPSWTLTGKVEVLGPLKTGSAYGAGLREGDHVLSIDGRDLASEQVLRDVERTMKPGDILELKVSRLGKEKVFRLPVGTRKIIHSSVVETERATRRQLELRNGILKDYQNGGE